jgi:hypothetical protein
MIDQYGFEYRKWALRFKDKDAVLFEKKVCIEHTR